MAVKISNSSHASAVKKTEAVARKIKKGHPGVAIKSVPKGLKKQMKQIGKKSL